MMEKTMPDASPRVEVLTCIVCGTRIPHDRVLYYTVSGAMKVVWKGRAHGDPKNRHRDWLCESGVKDKPFTTGPKKNKRLP